MDNSSDSDYSDSPGEASSPPAKSSDDSPETALAPRSLFPDDVEPGYQCKIEVVAVHSDEVEFKKLPHKESSSKPERKMPMTEPEPGDDYS